MKKALVVLLALAFVAGAFADAPVANLDVAEFTGSATVTWGVDLDTEKTGFKNETDASFKVNIADGGEAATSSDNAVWGEIEIKVGDALVVKQGALDGGKAEVEKALLHLGPVYMGILKDGTKVGAYDAPEAVRQQFGVGDVGPNRVPGVVLGADFGLAKIDVDFRNAGIGDDEDGQYNDDYAIRAKLGITAVENLDLNLGFSMAFESEEKGFGANAAYKLAIGDEFYLKPGVGYTNTLVTDDKGELAFGVLFGFDKGDTGDDEIGLPYFGSTDTDKGTSGVSVSTKLDLKADPMVIPLAVGFYAGDLVENLSAAVLLKTDDVENFGDNFIFKAALKYAAAVGDGTITPRAGVYVENDASLEATVGAEFAGFVDNTTFDAEWKSRNLSAKPDAKMGTFNVSVKIAL
jgi:hypothetical protein